MHVKVYFSPLVVSLNTPYSCTTFGTWADNFIPEMVTRYFSYKNSVSFSIQKALFEITSKNFHKVLKSDTLITIHHDHFLPFEHLYQDSSERTRLTFYILPTNCAFFFCVLCNLFFLLIVYIRLLLPSLMAENNFWTSEKWLLTADWKKLFRLTSLTRRISCFH